MIASGVFLAFIFVQDAKKLYPLNRDTVTCDTSGNYCQLQITDFDLRTKDISVGFYYENFTIEDRRYHGVNIDFWQTEKVPNFDCGLFDRVSDIKGLALVHRVFPNDEILQKAKINDKAIPCGPENGLFLLRERIVNITDSSITYGISNEDDSYLKLDIIASLKSNWIENLQDYYQWVRFLNAEGLSFYKIGTVSGVLPGTFIVNFVKGFGNLGESYPTYLMFQVHGKIDTMLAGVLFIIMGVLTTILGLVNIISMRKMRRFKKGSI